MEDQRRAISEAVGDILEQFTDSNPKLSGVRDWCYSYGGKRDLCPQVQGLIDDLGNISVKETLEKVTWRKIGETPTKKS